MKRKSQTFSASEQSDHYFENDIFEDMSIGLNSSLPFYICYYRNFVALFDQDSTNWFVVERDASDRIAAHR